MIFRRLLTVVVLIAIAWALVKFQDRVPVSIRDLGTQKETRADVDTGVSFSYPKNYILQEPPRGSQEHPDFIKAYILMRQEDYNMLATLEGTEGPPTISILVFRNPSGLLPTLWMQEPTIAPFIPPQATEPTVVTVGNIEGIAFESDGLYRSDNVVVMYGNNILFVSGSFSDAASPMRDVFQDVVASIEFIK